MKRVKRVKRVICIASTNNDFMLDFKYQSFRSSFTSRASDAS